MSTRTADMLGIMVALSGYSPVHATRTIETAIRLYAPPIALGRVIFWKDDHARVHSFLTHASLSTAVLEKVRAGGDLQPGDWESGGLLYVVDLVSPFGHAKEILFKLRSLYRGHRIHWRRRYKDGRARSVEVGYGVQG